jgi:hypothetical protein
MVVFMNVGINSFQMQCHMRSRIQKVVDDKIQRNGKQHALLHQVEKREVHQSVTFDTLK